MENFLEYLTGAEIEVLTHNNPLAYLETAKLGVLEQRWIIQLAQFNYKIKYKPGKFNRHVDALSQYPVEYPGEDVDFTWRWSLCCLRLPSLAPLVDNIQIPRLGPLKLTPIRDGL